MPTYPGISSDAFRHPLDYQAEQALRSIPGFDLLARKFMEFMYERPRYVYLMGNAIEVSPRQYASIYTFFRDCVRDLDVFPEPVLFVSQSPAVNAYALGQEHPCIVLNSGLLDLMSEAELRSTIAHELGHIKCGHTTLSQMASWALTLMFNLTGMTFGISNLVSTGLILAFYEWLRKAELSADRAALLVVDDLNPILQSMMRLSGGSSRYANELNLREFIRQSERYQDLDQDGLNQVYKFFLYNNLSEGSFFTHPFTVERVHYLGEWFNSEDYYQVRIGNYQRTNSETANTSSNTSDIERLRQEAEDLQREIDRIKQS
ncbi:MAG: M48 family metallopeptidase [Cyanobacteria bacterium CRU_2_1]|nr:M48 family metallopeptidase [Cyanobacteria bacterium CRU_2_1]